MNKNLVKNSALIVTGIGVAFATFWITSHPKSKVHRALPNKKYKSLQVLPHVKIVTKDKTYHFHHWLTFSVLYWRLFLKKQVFTSKLLHGMMLGSIFQGLTYKDRFRFRYKNSNPASME
ncbi:MAG TPA: hypothetical protein VLF89_00170 [Candidatus Saccharimonadales bacterium]|nr:hypothetical protein [Candidatus Saccharimonadales bacterium]